MQIIDIKEQDLFKEYKVNNLTELEDKYEIIFRNYARDILKEITESLSDEQCEQFILGQISVGGEIYRVYSGEKHYYIWFL